MPTLLTRHVRPLPPLPLKQRRSTAAAPHRWGPVLRHYGGALLLSLIVLAGAFKLWKMDFRVPLGMKGDALLVQILVRTLVEEQGFLHNHRLGAPEGLDLRAFPFYDLVPVFLMKSLALLTGDHGLTVNLFYLLTYPLTTLTALFALRQLRISQAPAVLAALLYTYLPYHFHRGIAHLFLAAYFFVPLQLLVALWLFQGKRILWYRKHSGRFPALDLRGHYTRVSILICAFSAAAGNCYYSFFACCFLACAALARSLWQRRVLPLMTGGSLCALMVLGAVVNVFPTLAYQWQHGQGPEPIQRQHHETEIYALKIVHLLLPTRNHRIGFCHELVERYLDPGVPLNNENRAAALGAVGAVGFLILLGRLLCPSRNAKPTLLAGLGVLNIAGVLLGTIGGVGSLISFFGWTWIRSYNRVSVFLAFLALASVANLLDRWLRWAALRWRSPVLPWVVVGAILGVGLFDQISRQFTPDHRARAAEFSALARYVEHIEARVPAGALIFQLPFLSYPEAVPVEKVKSYDQAFGYLHSRTLRWSFGALRGSDCARWQRAVGEQPLKTMLESLRHAGFQGLCIDRYGYPHTWPEMEACLVALLGVPPLVSGNERYSFFALP